MTDLANVAVFAIVAVGFAAVTLLLYSLLRAKASGDPLKGTTYECGMPVEGGAEVRVNIRFYTYALLFVLFDVEALYLFPWAVNAKIAGVPGLAFIGIFVGMLFLGLFYAWKMGALEWE